MQYLGAMGIDTFVPRRLLPAAKVPVACALPIEWVSEAVAAPSPQTPAVLPSGQVSSAFVQSLLTPAGRAAVQGESSAIAGEDMPAMADERTLQQWLAPKRQPVLRFSLALWQLANGVVLIDTREPKAALPTQALLHNIVQVLGRGLTLPKADVITWPLLHSAEVNPHEWQDAQDMVHAFLASRFEVLPPKLVIAMGNTAARLVLALSADASVEHAKCYTHEHLPCAVVALPSLAELLKQPLLKRYIWPALKPLF